MSITRFDRIRPSDKRLLLQYGHFLEIMSRRLFTLIGRDLLRPEADFAFAARERFFDRTKTLSRW
jgi:hypothetical protein